MDTGSDEAQDMDAGSDEAQDMDTGSDELPVGLHRMHERLCKASWGQGGHEGIPVISLVAGP